jgi:anaerobic selenocysteine-containing dehydrogenase
VPDWIGLSATEMVETSARGELDLFYCLGGNFLRTLPEPDYVARALANVPLRVHQDIILTDQMFIEAKEDVMLLPAKTRYEQDDGGIETTTERRIAFSPEIPRQVGEARAEWRILRDLAVAVDPERAHLLGCETGWKMREEIARIVPFYEGIQDLKNTGDAVQYGGPHLCAGWKFPTPDGKAHFRAVELPLTASLSPSDGERILPTKDSRLEPLNRKTPLQRGSVTRSGPAMAEVLRVTDPRSAGRGFMGRVAVRPGEGKFIVSTRRGKQFNSLVYADIDPINGAARDAVLMNPDDAANLRLMNDDRVALVNDIGRYEGRVFLAPIARGNLQIHWPEGNVIIRRGVVDKAGGVPDYNARVTLEKIL